MITDIELREVGFARGGYYRSCSDCAGEYIGDKRSARCMYCAVEAVKRRREVQSKPKLFKHSDGGIYERVADQEGRNPDTGKWIPGVAYRGVTSGALYWTDIDRWETRFMPYDADPHLS